jgi:hypothetical protein
LDAVDGIGTKGKEEGMNKRLISKTKTKDSIIIDH